MTVLPTGIWTQETADATHQSSMFLAAFMATHLPREQPVYDFGCGHGVYLAMLEHEGFHCIGVEGYPLTNFRASDVRIHDLTQPLYLGPRGSVISLEVGEHLPATAQETFMQTVTSHCEDVLIFSWAEIGQPGLGHINCRSQEDVIADVTARGFALQRSITDMLRQHIEDNCDWFRRTLLIFKRVK
jgi:hypothetical protein